MPYLALDWIQRKLAAIDRASEFGSYSVQKYKTPPKIQKGVLVYSFDLKETGKEGYQEVTVDATTGAVISTMHESYKTEAKEKAPKNPVKKPA